jgi:DNA-directed RNA polymerase subunit F
VRRLGYAACRRKARHAEKLGNCTPEVIDEVRAKLAALLGY